MKYKLQDLIDIQQFQSLQDMMNEVYSFTTAILDNEGNILTASGWQDICTKFHRVNPKSCKKCTISDSYIVDHIHEANPAVGYKCMNGMYDYAFPIIIDGTHYGNFFTGQFFFETPDVNFFKAQAKKYGFDEIEYLKALDNVPVITEERLNDLTLFLKELIQVISSVGLRNLKQSESNIALAESQALYHDLVETAQDLIWQVDAEGKYTYLNPAWEEVFGYKIGEMLGKKFSDFQTKYWANRDSKEFERLLQGSTVKGLETVHIGKNGKEIKLVFNAKFVRDGSGNIIGTRGTAFDITRIRKVEDELKESGNKYASLFASMSEGVALHEVIYDQTNKASDYRILELNPAFEKHTGIQLEKARNQIASEFYGTSPAPYLDIYSKVADTMIPTEFETYFPPLKKHFSISVFSPKKEMFATAFTDITKQKMMQEKIAKSELQFRTVFENSAVGMCLTSTDGKFLKVNSRLCQMLGYSNDELLNTTFRKITHPDDIAQSNALVAKVIDKQSDVFRFDKRYICKNGEVIWTEVSSSLLKDANGNSLYFITHIIDITDRKKAELEIQELNKELELRVAERTQELENTNKELQSFIYSVSHDLKAPLRSIMGFSEIISRRHAPRLNEEGKAYFGYVLEASKNMANLIEDLLRFSRLSKKSVDKETIELNDILEQVLQNLNQDILVFNAKIVAPDKMLTIYADRSLLIQILSNLISNGIKYHRKGVDPEIVISVDENEETSTIKISDNGQGIPKEHHEKIFNIFQRLHSSEEYPGTGIGLSIVKKAVASLGGEILVESELNKGSTFSVVIPKILKYF